MTQALLWQNEIERNDDYAKLCNALYERELTTLSNTDNNSLESLQGKLKSLPYYIKRTADHMTICKSPLTLDVQNGGWSLKQASQMPDRKANFLAVAKWYSSFELKLGLVIPIQTPYGFILDSIDRIDMAQQKIRTNEHGWFFISEDGCEKNVSNKYQLVKPTKKIFMLACAGHRWINQQRSQPKRLSLRELLLSCNINWQNLKKSSPALR